MDRTLILVKPDAFARGLTGEIISRFERKGLKIVALRHMTVTRELAERHYAEHAERPFFGDLVTFISRSPSLLMVLEGPNDDTFAGFERTHLDRPQQRVFVVCAADRPHRRQRSRRSLPRLSDQTLLFELLKLCCAFA